MILHTLVSLLQSMHKHVDVLSVFKSCCEIQIMTCSMQISTVFAQLTVKDKWEGPHVFVVRLRDADGNLMPGVRIKDNGHKAGLNGVDNGQIW